MNDFQTKLKLKMHQFVRFVYQSSKGFPKEELYGITSQLRRAALSIILNYIEGYARKRLLVRLQFLEISYGSLMESNYLIYFVKEEHFIDEVNYQTAKDLTDEIGAMLWTEISNLEKSAKRFK